MVLWNILFYPQLSQNERIPEMMYTNKYVVMKQKMSWSNSAIVSIVLAPVQNQIRVEVSIYILLAFNHTNQYKSITTCFVLQYSLTISLTIVYLDLWYLVCGIWSIHRQIAHVRFWRNPFHDWICDYYLISKCPQIINILIQSIWCN